jgi:mRNA interferase MazF
MQNGEEGIRRGDIYYADLSPVVGSEQGGVRPVLIVQNNLGNKYSPTVIAAAITSKTDIHLNQTELKKALATGTFVLLSII